MFVSSSIAALVAAGTVLAATPPGFEPSSSEDLQVVFCDNLAVNGVDVRQDELEMSPVLGTAEQLAGEYAVVMLDMPTSSTSGAQSAAYLRLMQTGLTSSSQVSRVAFQDMFELENRNNVEPLAPFIQPDSQSTTQYVTLLLNTTGCNMRSATLESSSKGRDNFNIAELVRQSGATVIAGSYFTGSGVAAAKVDTLDTFRKGQRPIKKRSPVITILNHPTGTPVAGAPQPTPAIPGQQPAQPPNPPPIFITPGGQLPVQSNQPNNRQQPGQPIQQQPGQPIRQPGNQPFPQQPGQPIQQQPGQPIQQPEQPIRQPFPQQPGQPIQQPGQPQQGQPGQGTLPAIVLPPGATPINTQTVIIGQPNQGQPGQGQPGATGTLPAIVLPGQPGQPQFTLPPGAVQPTSGQQIPGFRTPITSFTTPLIPGQTGIPNNNIPGNGLVPGNGFVPGDGNSGIFTQTGPVPGQQTGGLPAISGAAVALRVGGGQGGGGFALAGLSALVAALLF